nr:MAG TPA: hypothetical protein [Inoviridae sp.]
MKKIIAFLMALVMTTTVLFNTYKAHAMAVPVSYLTYLIQAVTEMLVGSGTCTQSQISDMNTSQLFETAKGAAPSIDWGKNAKWKADFIKDLNYFLNDAISKQIGDTKDFLHSGGLSEMVANQLVDWIDGHVNELPTVNPELLKGFGASCKVTLNSTGLVQLITFGAYGIIYNPGGSGTRSCELQPGDGLVKRISFQNDTSTETTFDSRKVGGYLGDESRTVQLVGDWRYVDGTPATDLITFVDEVPEAIGTVNVDGVDYDVNGDGTVTIDDKTYTINDDGSVTVDDKTYYPDYDISPYNYDALLDLLLRLLNNIDVTEDSTAGDLTDDKDFEMSEELANSELSSLVLPKTILTVFPFCIPWDFYNGIKLLSQEPEAPRFEVPFEIPAYKSFPGFKKMIVIDFSEYSSAFAIVRWTFFAIFMFGLCFVTFKIVKGV